MYEIQYTRHNCLTTRARTLKSPDWLKVVKQKNQCKFHNKLLTAVEQYIIACVQNSFLWL